VSWWIRDAFRGCNRVVTHSDAGSMAVIDRVASGSMAYSLTKLFGPVPSNTIVNARRDLGISALPFLSIYFPTVIEWSSSTCVVDVTRIDRESISICIDSRLATVLHFANLLVGYY
jgi:hypothetical protein